MDKRKWNRVKTKTKNDAFMKIHISGLMCHSEPVLFSKALFNRENVVLWNDEQ